VAFAAALDNDLEASAAMAAIHGLVGDANRRLAAGTLRPEDAAGALRVLGAADQVLGLGLGGSRGALDPRQQALFAARQEARDRKDWAASDRLRDELHALGVLVKDTPGGQESTLL